jgi:hypothetical protein
MKETISFEEMFCPDSSYELPLWSKKSETKVGSSTGILPVKPHWKPCTFESNDIWRHLIRRIQIRSEA